MTDAKTAPKKRRWLKILLGLFVAFVVFIVAAYLFATSAYCLKHIILPKVGQSMGATVTVGDASIHPFSSVDLHDLKVVTTGTEPLLTVGEVKLVYHLRDILGGNIHVEEVTVNSPVVQIITNPDGSSNLDPLLKKSSPAPAKSAAPSKRSAPPILNIAKVSLTGATVRTTKLYKGGTSDVSVVSNVNVTLENLRNGQTAKVTIGAGLAVDNHPPVPATNLMLRASLDGNFNIALQQDLKPGTVTGTTKLQITQAGGAAADLSGMAVVFNCDMTPTSVKEIALNFQQNAASLGQIRVSGPLDLEKMEGKLQVDIPSLDRRVLSLASAGTGLDFGPAIINSSNVIEIAKAGQSIVVDGQFNATRLALTQNGKTMPTLDFHAAYGATVDLASKEFSLRNLAVNGLQNQRPLLVVNLTSPMKFSLAALQLQGNAELGLQVTNFNLAEWQPLLGTNASGKLDLGVDLKSDSAGQHLNLGVNGQLGQFVFNNFQAKWDVNAGLTNKHLHIEKAAGSISQSTGAGGTFDFKADYDLAANAGQLSFKITDLNQNALRPFLDPSLSGSKLVSVSINADATASVTTQGAAAVRGQFKLANFVANDPVKHSNTPALSVGLNIDVGFDKKVAQLNQFQIALAPTSKANNELNLTGKVDLSDSNAVTGNLKLAAQALDLSDYYDLFAPKQSTAKPAPATVQPTLVTSSKPAPEVEPAAKQFPVKNFTFNVDIQRVLLHEIDISNFQVGTKVDGGHIVLQPFSMSLNGAPVKADADVDMSIAGFKYAVNFSANKMPVAPLADTFSPAYKGVAKGDLIAMANIKGAGITGPNLKKNLFGDVSLLLTNASVSLGVGQRVQFFMQYIINPIFVALRLPDVSHDVLAVADLSANVKDGTVSIGRFKAVAANFVAISQGTLTLNDVLTNSTINNLPIVLGLPVAAAKKANLAPANLPANATYVDLGSLATVGGTIGKPDVKIDKTAIAMLAGKVGLKAVEGLGGSVGGDAGKILNGVSGVLGGGANTNTNANGSGGILNGIRNLNPFGR